MNIEFSETEKISYLVNKGYSVFTRTETVLHHVHGSRFIEQYKTFITAEKAGHPLKLDQAFEAELKAQLLQL